MSKSTTVDHDQTALGQPDKYLPLAAVVVMLAAHLPLLVRLGRRMWALEHYQFFPLILAAAAFIGYQRFKEAGQLDSGRPIWRVVLVLISFCTLLFAILADSPWFAAISALVTVWTGIYLVGGRKLLSHLWPVWILLCLAVPLPMGLDSRLILGLQESATRWASGMLDFFGYRHLVSGVVLELPSRSFEVEEACSGIHSLFAAITCTVIYSIVMRLGILRVAFLILATVFWVLVVNAVRVTLITVLCSRWDLPIATGIGHDLVGAITFVVALLLIASSAQFLELLFPYPFHPSEYFSFRRGDSSQRSLLRPWTWKTREPGDTDKGAADSTPADAAAMADEPTDRKTRLSGPPQWAMVAVMALFGVLGIAQFAATGALGKIKPDMDIAQISRSSATSLPAQIDGWSQVKFERVTRADDDINGKFSCMWHFQNGDTRAIISIDGPFVGWHDLARCLRGQGWSVAQTDIRELPCGDQREIPHVQMKIEKGLSRHASVFFAVLDEQNRAAQPPTSEAGFRVVRRLPRLARLFSSEDTEHARADSTTYQIQLFHESARPHTQQQFRQLEQFFARAVQHVASQPSAAASDTTRSTSEQAAVNPDG